MLFLVEFLFNFPLFVSFFFFFSLKGRKRGQREWTNLAKSGLGLRYIFQIPKFRFDENVWEKAIRWVQVVTNAQKCTLLHANWKCLNNLGQMTLNLDRQVLRYLTFHVLHIYIRDGNWRCTTRENTLGNLVAATMSRNNQRIINPLLTVYSLCLVRFSFCPM